MEIKLLEVKDNGDGTQTVVFDYDDEFLEYVKEKLNNDSPSEEEISNFISSTIQESVDAYKQQAIKEGESV